MCPLIRGRPGRDPLVSVISDSPLAGGSVRNDKAKAAVGLAKSRRRQRA